MDNAAERTYSDRHTIPADLAAALRGARQDRGLGLREVAGLVGVDAGHLSRIERAERCPSVAVARDLVAKLKLAPDLAARLLAVARPDAGRSWHGSPAQLAAEAAREARELEKRWTPPRAGTRDDRSAPPDLLSSGERG